MPFAKFAERQLLYTPNEPVNKRDDRVKQGGGRSAAEELVDALHEYAVDGIVCHVGEGDQLRHAVPWHTYKPANSTVEPAERIPEPFISPYRRRQEKNGTVRQPRGQVPVNRRGKVRK